MFPGLVAFTLSRFRHAFYSESFASLSPLAWSFAPTPGPRVHAHKFPSSLGAKRAAVGVAAVRSVVRRFPDDAELLQIPTWIRENRSRAPDLKVGDVMPDVTVVPVDAHGDVGGKAGIVTSAALPCDGLLAAVGSGDSGKFQADDAPAVTTTIRKPVSNRAPIKLSEFCRRTLERRGLSRSKPVVLAAGSVT